MVNRSGGHALTMKAALALGFGATFGLWLFAGYHFSQRMSELQHEAAGVNRRYMRAQELLSNVRAQVLLGSVHVRDALLDPDRNAVHEYRRRVQETYDKVDRAVQEYVPILDSAQEQLRVQGLRTEIQGLRVALLDVLATDSRLWSAQAPQLLSEVMPRRTSVMQVSDTIQKLNRSAFVQQRDAVATIYVGTQRQVWEALGFTLAGSLAIAVLATVYVIRLEGDLQRQQFKQLQTTTDLQRLSTKLVTMQEEERRTIARELHDEIGQVLMAIKVELALAQRRVEADGGPERLLEDAQSITDSALHTVRDLSHLLHPALLDDLGISAAIDSYLTGFRKRYRMSVELVSEDMIERLSPEIELATYRIVQEALTNVAKHAGATLVFIYVRRQADTLQVSIKDNGVGFEPASARHGLGLIGIRERAASLRGTVRVDSAPGKGTTLTVALPARARASTGEAGDSDGPSVEGAITRPEVRVG